MQGGGWHNRFLVPFSRSIRVTVQLPLDVPANASNGMFMILRGLEGDPNPLTVGSITLPPIVPWGLRLRKFTTHLNHVQPLEFVDFVNYTSATSGEDSGGALLMTVLVLSPGPGDDGRLGTGLQGGATEGCFRAYTERRFRLPLLPPLDCLPSPLVGLNFRANSIVGGVCFENVEGCFWLYGAQRSHVALARPAARHGHRGLLRRRLHF